MPPEPVVGVEVDAGDGVEVDEVDVGPLELAEAFLKYCPIVDFPEGGARFSDFFL